jgi:hypothetical protein
MFWEWFLNGVHLAGHDAVSFVPMPNPINDWLIATRPGCCDFRGFMDEVRGSDSALEVEDFLFAVSITPSGGDCRPDASELTIRDAWYRWEEGAGNSVHNALDNDSVDGNFIGSYTDDTVGQITDGLTGNTHDNNFAYQANGVEELCTITKTSFVLHKPDGDATFETLVKVRSPNPGHQSIVWSNPGAESNRFNIFWNANFVASPDSDRFVSGDFVNGTGVNIAANGHDVGNPQPIDQWFHMAIVRTDNGDTSFDWNWYLNGILSPSHAVTTPPGAVLPTAAKFLIAGRNFTGHRLMIDEFRMMQQALSPAQFLTADGLVPDFRSSTDFSTASNPNGAWSYRDGDGDLITNVVSDWQSGELGASQEAYADSQSALPGWALATGDSTLDLPAGELFTHGPSQIWWTAPETGNVSLGGGLWVASEMGSSGQVQLRLNDIATAFTRIDLTSENSSSVQPVRYSAGDGGREVTMFGVQAGDVLKFSTDIEDYVVFEIDVFSTPTATPKPPPIETPVARVYDSGADFSDFNNPNGAWSYRDGGGALLEDRVEEWLPNDLGIEHPAWAVSEQFPPGWALSNGASLAGPHPEYDWPVDTIMSHGPSVLRWKAPGDGNVTISGGVWLLRSFDRDQSVRIAYQGTIFASGSLVSAESGAEGTVNSTSPLLLDDFGKAPGALSFGVRFRDAIDFSALPLSGVDDFVAYAIQIDFQPGEPANEGPTILTNPPQAALPVEYFALDVVNSSDVYTVAVGDFNGDENLEAVWGAKSGGAGPNLIRAIYVNDTPFGLSISAVEEVAAVGPNEGPWLVRAGDFLGIGFDQLLVGGNWQFSGDDLRFQLFDRTNDPAGTAESWSPIASMTTNLASTGYSAVADVFGNGQDSIVLGSGNGSFFTRLLCFNVDSPNFIELHDGGGGSRMTATFVGDISGDGVLDVGYFFTFGPANEIGFKSFEDGSDCVDSALTETGHLLGNTASNAPFDGSAAEIFDRDVGMGLRRPAARGEGGSIVVGDPSRDGRNEIIVPLGGALDGYLVSWQATAATHGGLPVDVESEFEVIDIRRGATFTAVALGDVNNDGLLDVVAGTSDAEIFVYTRTSDGYSPGNTLPATLADGGGAGVVAGNAYQRCNLSNFDNSNIGAITGLEIADIDNDDELEIVFSTDFGLNYGRAPGNTNGIHMLNDLVDFCPNATDRHFGFRRGDHDGSGLADITDALNLLGFLFLGTTPPICEDASDFDNSGALDITDALNLLGHLFLGQPSALPSPGTGPSCGVDPSTVQLAIPPIPEQAALTLGCDRYPGDAFPEARCP